MTMVKAAACRPYKLLLTVLNSPMSIVPYSKNYQKFNKAAMPDTRHKDKANWLAVEGKKTRFNVDKLQAVLCIAASTGISMALIIWAIAALI